MLRISPAAIANDTALAENGKPGRDVEQERPDRQPGDAAGDDLGGEQQAVGASELGRFDQQRQERLRRTVEQHLARSDDHEQQEQRPDRQAVGHGGVGDHDEQHDPHEVGEQHQVLAVDPVDDHTHRQRQQHPRQERGERDERDQPLVVGERQCEQGHRHEVDAVAEIADRARRPLPPVGGRQGTGGCGQFVAHDGVGHWSLRAADTGGRLVRQFAETQPLQLAERRAWQ